jgi:transcriptional regulator with XRE-family HTH domain
MKNRLRAARIAQGLTQTELAERAGMSQRLVSSIETSDRDGSIDTWQKLAKALGCNVSWLTGEAAARDPSDVGPVSILADTAAPPGLKQLALDLALIQALEITPEEWRALRSIEPPGVLTKSGYSALLFTLRCNVKVA